MSETVLQRFILDWVQKSERRLTVPDLYNNLPSRSRSDKKALQASIRGLVEQRELVYVTEDGHTFVEKAFNKPVRVSTRIVIKPNSCCFRAGPEDVVVNIDHGLSFGSGRHATTRLCLQGLDAVLTLRPDLAVLENTSALDVGTGSGILIIAAVRMGLTRGVGIDTDPVSISEARQNVFCDDLAERIAISSQPFEIIQERFDVITANLRWPTLTAYLSKCIQNLKKHGVLILSGIRTRELSDLIETGVQNRLSPVWRGTDSGWGAVVFSKKI